MSPADLEGQSKVTDRYHRALEREALTLRSRVASLGVTRRVSVAQAMSEPDPDRRRALMREAGVDLDEAR